MANKLKCEYYECKLPKTNRRYIAQVVYLIISVLFFLKDEESFTFFPILMYTAPILIDLFYNDVEGGFYNFIRKFFIFFNVTLGIFCVLGLAGIVVDNGAYFSFAEGTLIKFSFILNKSLLFWPLCFNIIVPVTFYYGCPTQKTSKVVGFFRKEKSGAI